MSRVLRFHFSPGDRVVLIGVEPEHEVEIAKRDVPLASRSRLASTLRREIAVRRLVRSAPVRRTRRAESPAKASQNFISSTSPAFAPSRPRLDTRCPISASQRLTVSRAAAVAGGGGSFRQDAQVRGLALRLPVVERERQRACRDRAAARARNARSRAGARSPRARGSLRSGRATLSIVAAASASSRCALRQWRVAAAARRRCVSLPTSAITSCGALLVEQPIAVRADEIQIARSRVERRPESAVRRRGRRGDARSHRAASPPRRARRRRCARRPASVCAQRLRRRRRGVAGHAVDRRRAGRR